MNLLVAINCCLFRSLHPDRCANVFLPLFPAGLFRRTPGSRRRDCETSVKHEVLQGVKDPRELVGMAATRKRGLRGRQPPLGGLTK
jgi:hypothetical protein